MLPVPLPLRSWCWWPSTATSAAGASNGAVQAAVRRRLLRLPRPPQPPGAPGLAPAPPRLRQALLPDPPPREARAAPPLAGRCRRRRRRAPPPRRRLPPLAPHLAQPRRLGSSRPLAFFLSLFSPIKRSHLWRVRALPGAIRCRPRVLDPVSCSVEAPIARLI